MEFLPTLPVSFPSSASVHNNTLSGVEPGRLYRSPIVRIPTVLSMGNRSPAPLLQPVCLTEAPIAATITELSALSARLLRYEGSR